MRKLLKTLDLHVRSHGTLKNAESIVKKNGIDVSEWKQRTCFTEPSYSKTMIGCTENVSVYVISWKPGDASPIHAHPEGGCIMKILQGDLFEEKVDVKTLEIIAEDLHGVGDTAYIDNAIAYHKITNIGSLNAVSLHVYPTVK